MSRRRLFSALLLVGIAVPAVSQKTPRGSFPRPPQTFPHPLQTLRTMEGGSSEGGTSDGTESAHPGGATVTAKELQIPADVRRTAREAEAALAHQDLRKAEKLANQALKSAPSYARALVVKALLRLNEGKFPQGIAELKTAAQCDPDFAGTYVALGAASNSLQKFTDSRQYLEKALQLDPNIWQAHLEMAKAWLGLRDFENALKEASRSQELTHTPRPEISLVKAWAFVNLQRYPEARTELQAFLQEAPDAELAPTVRKLLRNLSQLATKSGN